LRDTLYVPEVKTNEGTMGCDTRLQENSIQALRRSHSEERNLFGSTQATSPGLFTEISEFPIPSLAP